MIKRILIIGLLWLSAGIAVAAPNWIYQVGIMPTRNSAMDLGTTTLAWRDFFIDRICLTADSCRTTWPTGGASSFNYNAFTNPSATTFATTTSMSLANGTFIGFAGNTTVDTSNYSLFGNTTLTLLNARSGASIGFRIANTDVGNISTNGGFGWGPTYYNIDAGSGKMIIENGLGVGSSTPGTLLSVGGDGTGINLVDNGTSTFSNGIVLASGCIYKKSTGACISEVPSNITGILQETAGSISNVTVGSSLDYTGTTLSVGTVAIGDGGTNATSQTTNGVNYFNGTSITSGTALTFNGTNFGVGTSSAGTLLGIGNTTGWNFSEATSSAFATGGLNLNAGCFAIRGTCVGAGGAGTPGGSDTQIQYNNAGSFGGASTLLWNGTNLSLATTTFGTLFNVGSAANFANSTSTIYSALRGGKQTLLNFSVLGAETPNNNEFATFDTRNAHAVLDFDDTVEETAYFTGVMPQIYSGGNITVEIHYAMTSATTNSVQWDISFERLLSGTDDLDAYSFGATSTVTQTVPSGSAGVVSKALIDVTAGTNMDNITFGDLFRLNVTRNGGADNATGDAEVLNIVIRER